MATGRNKKNKSKTAGEPPASRRLRPPPKQQRAGTCLVLIAIDASRAAERAGEAGIEIASCLRAKVAFVHVVDSSRIMVGGTPAGVPEAVEELRHRGRGLCDEMARAHGVKGHKIFVTVGSPAVEILAVAKRCGADMIVMGSHGGAHRGEFFLGSNVEIVIRQSGCPVLTVGPDGPQRRYRPAPKGGVTLRKK